MAQIQLKDLPPDTKRKADRAKTQLLLKNPFFGSLLLQCKHIWTKEVPTAATDGRDLLFNPDFVNTISEVELQGVIVHELLHKIFLHAIRRKAKQEYIDNGMRFNVAADYAINPIVIESGFTLPSDCLIDDKYKDMMAEEIYPLLPEDVEPSMADLINGPAGDLTQQEQTELEREVSVQVGAAAITDKNWGNLPGAIKNLIDKIGEQKVDWRAALSEFIQTTIHGDDDITFKRPNRRMLAHDLYLPSTEGVVIPPISIMFDTSGSIYSYPEVVSQFVAEIKSIVDHLQPECTHLICNDTKVQSHEPIMPGEELVVELEGGGGTDFKEAFEFIQDLEYTPVMNIVFTDLYFDFSNLVPTIPTLWVTYGDGNNEDLPDFGQLIHIEGD